MPGRPRELVQQRSRTLLLLFVVLCSGVNCWAPGLCLSRTSRFTQLNYDTRRYAKGKDDSMTPEEREKALNKALKAMTSFSNTYIKKTDTRYCKDLSVPAVVIKGLAEHKVSLGAPLCPCRFYEDKDQEVKDGYWNCPCVPMRERKECHCMLFLTEDHDFAGEETTISVEEVIEKSTQAASI